MKKNDSTTFAKENLIHLKTSRLILRQWKPDDYSPFSKMNLDPDVMQYLPNTLSRKESDVLSKKIESFIEKNGWGMWAVELKSKVNLLAL